MYNSYTRIKRFNRILDFNDFYFLKINISLYLVHVYFKVAMKLLNSNLS